MKRHGSRCAKDQYQWKDTLRDIIYKLQPKGPDHPVQRFEEEFARFDTKTAPNLHRKLQSNQSHLQSL